MPESGMRMNVAVCAAAVALVLSGCGSYGTPEPSPTTTPMAPAPTTTVTVETTVYPTDENDPVSPAPYATASTSAAPAGALSDLLITDVRTGAHDGFDRVVIEFDAGASKSVAWSAGYMTDPRAQGSGLPIVIPGASAVLGVTVHGLRIPNGETVLSGLLDGSAHGGIRGVYLDPVFEGISVINIGLDAQRGFYVFGMEAPNRLVIDIQS